MKMKFGKKKVVEPEAIKEPIHVSYDDRLSSAVIASSRTAIKARQLRDLILQQGECTGEDPKKFPEAMERKIIEIESNNADASNVLDAIGQALFGSRWKFD